MSVDGLESYKEGGWYSCEAEAGREKMAVHVPKHSIRLVMAVRETGAKGMVASYFFR